jgi:hypothetical protein
VEISETDKSYAAGIFDGEGSVTINWSKKRYHRIDVRVAMVDSEVIYWFGTVFGGHVDLTNKTKTGRQIYRWTLHCRRAANFLRIILPYLRLKKLRAELGIELTEITRKRGALKGKEGNTPLHEKELERRHEIALRIRAENQRSNPKICSYSTWGIS